MENKKTFEYYPLWMIACYDIVTLGIYCIGAYIMFMLNTICGWLFLLYCLILEIKVMRVSCIHCYYYGKLCGIGRGKLASLFFGKGEPIKFLEKRITWKDFVLHLPVSVIPFVVGIYLLFRSFSLLTLVLIILLFIWTITGNGFLMRNIVCKYCKQKELGCPAEKLFAKAN